MAHDSMAGRMGASKGPASLVLDATHQWAPTRDHRRAFTLVELLLAVGLSALLLLVAVATFKAVTRTMSDLDRLAEENRLLRSGYLLVTQDVDYWRSEADPSWPYLRGHQSETDNGNDLFDVRPFRPVVWAKNLDDPRNPNWPQPHDPRSWYRNHLLPMVQTGAFYYDSDGKYYYRPDFAVEGTRDEFSALHGGEYKRLTGSVSRPPGWETWHWIGDYAVLQNVEMDAAPGRPDHVRGSRPVLHWTVFEELGTTGCMSYLPAGAPNLILASTANETQENYRDLETRLDTHFSKGEVPWSLHIGKELLQERAMGVLDGARPAEDFRSLPASFAARFPRYNRQNYAIAMPSFLDALRDDLVVQRRYPFLADLDVYASDGRGYPILMFGENYADGMPLVPLALCYPMNPKREDLRGDIWDWYDYEYACVYPIHLMHARGRQFNEGGKMREPIRAELHWRDMQEIHTHRTSHQPAAYTDAPTVAVRDEAIDRSTLASRIYRHRYNGNDRARCSIRLQDSRGDTGVELRFHVLSTDFRGARQHWGARSGSGGIDDGHGNRIEMGDRYE